MPDVNPPDLDYYPYVVDTDYDLGIVYWSDGGTSFLDVEEDSCCLSDNDCKLYT